MLRTKAFLEPGNHRARIGAVSSEILFIRGGGAGRGRGRGRARVESWFGLAGNNSESQFVRRRINSNFAGRMNSPRNCVSPHRPIPLRANLNRAASTSSTPPANLERQRCIILPPPSSLLLHLVSRRTSDGGGGSNSRGGREKKERTCIIDDVGSSSVVVGRGIECMGDQEETAMPPLPLSRSLSSLAMNNFEEDTVIMAHDATNGIDKPDILDDK